MIPLQQAADAVERAALNLRGLVEALEANPKRRDLPDVPMRRSHARELFATAKLLRSLAQHAPDVRALLQGNADDPATPPQA